MLGRNYAGLRIQPTTHYRLVLSQYLSDAHHLLTRMTAYLCATCRPPRRSFQNHFWLRNAGKTAILPCWGQVAGGGGWVECVWHKSSQEDFSMSFHPFFTNDPSFDASARPLSSSVDEIKMFPHAREISANFCFSCIFGPRKPIEKFCQYTGPNFYRSFIRFIHHTPTLVSIS